jgi:lambda family phage tail tape measure protein
MALDNLISGLFRNIMGGFGGSNVLSGGLALGMGGIGHNAMGNAFANGNVIPFARGTVIDRPTMFPMAKGGVGIMGEAGEEAIMPLRRTAGGRLGVEMARGGDAGTTVNISVDARGAAAGVGAEVHTAIARAIDRYDRFQAPRTIAHHKDKKIIETGANAA